jgi:ABC-type proline/glycine betaine transport system substrate-binding protein
MKGSTPTRASPAAPTLPTLIIAGHAATLEWTPPASAQRYTAQLRHDTTGLLETKGFDAPMADTTFAFVTVTGQSYSGRVRAYVENEPGPWTAWATDEDPG